MVWRRKEGVGREKGTESKEETRSTVMSENDEGSEVLLQCKFVRTQARMLAQTPFNYIFRVNLFGGKQVGEGDGHRGTCISRG
eukprot:1907290-Pleurochrysis_carterae.AAC.1